MTLPTTRTTAFLPYVLPYVEGCPRTTAEFMLRLAAIEFCEKTRSWRHITTMALATNGEAIVAPEYSTIHEFETATLDGTIALTPTQFTDISPDELTGSVATGVPRYITQIAPNTVSVYPFATGTLRVSLFLKPRAGSLFGTDAADPMHDAYNVVPEFLLVQHANAIAAGALARILSIPNERFSDLKRAAGYGATFTEACDRKFASNMVGQQRAPIRTKTRWF